MINAQAERNGRKWNGRKEWNGMEGINGMERNSQSSNCDRFDKIYPVKFVYQIQDPSSPSFDPVGRELVTGGPNQPLPQRNLSNKDRPKKARTLNSAKIPEAKGPQFYQYRGCLPFGENQTQAHLSMAQINRENPRVGGKSENFLGPNEFQETPTQFHTSLFPKFHRKIKEYINRSWLHYQIERPFEALSLLFNILTAQVTAGPKPKIRQILTAKTATTLKEHNSRLNEGSEALEATSQSVYLVCPRTNYRYDTVPDERLKLIAFMLVKFNFCKSRSGNIVTIYRTVNRCLKNQHN